MTELIREDDTLNQGRKKLNNAIKAFNETVVKGDSSVEAAQARVDEKGEVHPTLKARIDNGFTEVTSQLAHKVERSEVFLKEKGININDFDEPTRQTFLEAQGIDVNYVLGDGNVKRRNLENGAVSFDKTNFLSQSSNLFNTSNLMIGKSIDTDGNIEDNEDRALSDYIEVVPGETIYMSSDPQIRVGVYTKEKVFADRLNKMSGVKEFLVPQNIYFIRLSPPIEYVDTLMVNRGSGLLPYVPHYITFKSDFPFIIKPKMIMDGSLEGVKFKNDTIATEKIKNKSITHSKLSEDLEYNKPTYGAEVLSYPQRRERLKEIAEEYSDFNFIEYNSEIEGEPARLVSTTEILNITPSVYHGYFAIQYYAQDDNLNRFRVDLMSGDNDFIRFEFNNLQEKRIKKGLNYLIFAKKDIVLENGNFDPHNVNRIRFSNTGVTGGHSFRVNKAHSYKMKAMVTIWFDDGHKTVHSTAFPIMDAAGFRGTHAIVGDWLNKKENIMLFSDLEEMQRAGWEHCNHTYFHEKFKDISLNRIELSIQKGLDFCQAMSFGKSSYYLVNPGGQTTAESLPIEKKYSTVRRIGIGDNYFPIIDFHNLKSKEPMWETPATEIFQWVDEAIESGLWLILLFHQIRPSNLPGLSRYPEDQFQLLIDYLKQKQDNGELRVLTCGQVIATL